MELEWLGNPSGVHFEISEAMADLCSVVRKGQNIHVKSATGELVYYDEFFTRRIADRMLEYAQENNTFDLGAVNWRLMSETDFSNIEFANIQWVREKISIYGRTVPLPRLTAWYGDTGASYNYSGINCDPHPWNKGLIYFKECIEKVVGAQFNSVLLNWYVDGNDYLSWHSDNEPELGDCPIIASVSIGEERDFMLRMKSDHSHKITFRLRHGSLLLMRGPLQKFWEHSVPKRKRSQRSRINLTFRHIYVC